MAMRRAFLRFLAGYILLLLVPLSLGTFITRNFVAEYEEKVVETRIGQLQQAKDVMARYVEDLEWRVYQIAGNTDMNRYLMGTPDANVDRRLLLKGIVEDLNSIMLYDSSMDSVFYVHALKDNIILTPNSVYDASDFVDGKTYFRMDGISTSDWLAEVFSKNHNGRFYPAVPVTFEDFKNKSMIPYVRSLPLSFNGRLEDVTAAIVYFIGEDEFSGLLRHVDLPEGGWVYIADGENRILSKRSNTENAFSATLPEGQPSGSFRMVSGVGENLLVTYVVSEDNGWRFVSVLPVPWVFRSVRLMQALSYGVLLLALFLSVGISAIISWRRSETLGTLFGLLGDDEAVQSPMDYGDLNVGVSRLVRTNAEMKKELVRQRQFVFGNFINRLLNGYYRDEMILSRFREYLGLTEEYRRFSAIALLLRGRGEDESVYGVQELVYLKNQIRDELMERFPGVLWTYETDEDLIACIFHSKTRDDDEHERSVTESLEDRFAQWSGTASYGLHVGMGETVSSLLRIHSSWVHAREAAEFAGREGSRLSRFADIERRLDAYYYPIELEIRLLNAVRAGDVDTLDDVFAEIRDENIVGRNLTEENGIWLLNEIRSSWVKLENRLGPGKWEDIAQGTLLDEGLEEYRKRFREVCRIVNNRKKSHNSELIRKIERYLDERYSDHNLSLSSVAGKFSITESYLSYFFKEQTGENFSSRVEGIRIGRAEELLNDTAMTIADIAIEVGYNSDKTFRRVFRRLKGLSPTDYRKEAELNRIV